MSLVSFSSSLVVSIKIGRLQLAVSLLTACSTDLANKLSLAFSSNAINSSKYFSF